MTIHSKLNDREGRAGENRFKDSNKMNTKTLNLQRTSVTRKLRRNDCIRQKYRTTIITAALKNIFINWSKCYTYSLINREINLKIFQLERSGSSVRFQCFGKQREPTVDTLLAVLGARMNDEVS